MMRENESPQEEGLMKKTYLTPESRVKDLELEWNFLLSGGLDTGIGSLDDPEDDDPWN
jgi:hypothetical protein